MAGFVDGGGVCGGGGGLIALAAPCYSRRDGSGPGAINGGGQSVRNTFIDYELPKCMPDGELMPRLPRVWKTDPTPVSSSGLSSS